MDLLRNRPKTRLQTATENLANVQLQNAQMQTNTYKNRPRTLTGGMFVSKGACGRVVSPPLDVHTLSRHLRDPKHDARAFVGKVQPKTLALEEYTKAMMFAALDTHSAYGLYSLFPPVPLSVWRRSEDGVEDKLLKLYVQGLDDLKKKQAMKQNSSAMTQESTAMSRDAFSDAEEALSGTPPSNPATSSSSSKNSSNSKRKRCRTSASRSGSRSTSRSGSRRSAHEKDDFRNRSETKTETKTNEGFWETAYPRGDETLASVIFAAKDAAFAQPDGYLSPRQMLALAEPFAKLAHGLVMFHASGLCHDDLHAKNILRCGGTSAAPESFKIIDFGSAQTLDLLVAAGAAEVAREKSKEKESASIASKYPSYFDSDEYAKREFDAMQDNDARHLGEHVTAALGLQSICKLYAQRALHSHSVEKTCKDAGMIDAIGRIAHITDLWHMRRANLTALRVSELLNALVDVLQGLVRKNAAAT